MICRSMYRPHYVSFNFKDLQEQVLLIKLKPLLFVQYNTLIAIYLSINYKYYTQIYSYKPRESFYMRSNKKYHFQTHCLIFVFLTIMQMRHRAATGFEFRRLYTHHTVVSQTGCRQPIAGTCFTLYMKFKVWPIVGG